MAIYAVFGVGVGNLGRHRAPRRPMLRWLEMLNEHLLEGNPSVQIVGFFGHTGNFLADSPSTNLDDVTARSGRLLDTDWVVRSIDDIRASLTAVADAPEPETEDGIRWTLGLAFQGRAGIERGRVLATPRAVLTSRPLEDLFQHYRGVEARQSRQGQLAGQRPARRRLGRTLRRH